MTHGDVESIKCPHCRKPNRVTAQVGHLPVGQIREFEAPCQHCGKRVYYWARWTVTLDAEKPEKAT